jgi:predicted Zn-dependent protease
MPAPVQQKPRVQTPVARTMPLPEEKAPQVESLGSPPPEIAETPNPGAEVLVMKPSKQYKSSSAVQSLLKQADTETANGKLGEAVATIERALRIESDNPDLWLKLAKLNEQQGNHQQAVSMLGKAKYYQELLD